MMERVTAFFILVLISPLIIFLWFVFRLTTPGSFVFRQKRTGKNFTPFYIYKIRTMVENAEKSKNKYSHLNQADGPVFKIYDDPRLTTIGKILWKTGLDEILQLVNVVKGEMSFVGPRPLPVDEAKKIPKKYIVRFTVKPGMTSLWIVRGAHRLTFDQWMESDLEYVTKKNLLMDAFILAKTAVLVIRWSLKEIRFLLNPNSP